MRSPSAAITDRPVFAAVPSQCGFSLLELLVALTVIVLVTSLVSFSFNSGGQEVQLESNVRNLASVASYALDEAQMTGVNYGLLLKEDVQQGETSFSYSWLERQVEGWRDPATGNDLFAPQHFPPGIALELELEEAPVVELSLDDNDQEIISPQVIFYASGEATVGAINVRRLEDSALLWRIEWDLFGRFKVLPRGEEIEEIEEEDF